MEIATEPPMKRATPLKHTCSQQLSGNNKKERSKNVEDLRKSTRNTKLDLVGAKLNVRDAEILRPAKAHLG